MAEDGAQTVMAPLCHPDTAASSAHSADNGYTLQLTRVDLDDSLATMYGKMANKFQTELNKSIAMLSQELAALEKIEQTDEELHMAYSDLRKDHKLLSETGGQLQAPFEDLDNRNRQNNIRIRIVPESTTDLPRTFSSHCSLIPHLHHSSVTGSIGPCN